MQSDPQAIDPAGWLAERGQAWLDARLAESTAARESLAPIDGKRFELVLEGPDVHVCFRAERERLILEHAGQARADARLSVSPLDALKLARGQSLSQLKATDARLEGDTQVAETFARTLALLSPDPEAELAGWIGDMAAHEIVSAGRRIGALIVKAERALEQDAAEYFTEERPTLARRWEVDEFVEAVDSLRDAVERAASRLDALERGGSRPAAGGPTPEARPDTDGAASTPPSAED